MNRSRTRQPADHSFQARIIEIDMSGLELLLVPTGIDSVISFRGSFLSPSWNNGRFRVAQDLAIACLDKGTHSHTKDEISDILEPVGARLNFYADGQRVRVSGRCLKEDFPVVVALMKEQLVSPAFLPEEVERVRDRMRAAYQRTLTDTSFLASSALSRLIYPSEHPNFTPDSVSDLSILESITYEDIRAIQQSWIPLVSFRFTAVGDINRDNVEQTFLTHFETVRQECEDHESDKALMEARSPSVWLGGVANEGIASVQEINLPGKESLDVRLGHAIDLSVIDERIRPLTLGVFALGGNFSARLMNIVRDELGLTYGIGSSLTGFDLFHHGAWTISVTLSKDKLEEGLDATRRELDRFAENGLSAAELEEKKHTLCGIHKVSLSTTAQISMALLRNAEKNRDPGYIDLYPDLINQVDLDTVNGLIRACLKPEILSCTTAGTIISPEKT